MLNNNLKSKGIGLTPKNTGYVADDTELLSEVFNAVTSAIIVLDKKGCIVRANQSALDMFDGDLISQKWITVVKNFFVPMADDGHEVSLKNGKKILVSTKPLSVGQLVVLTDVTPTRQLQERVSHMERLSSLGKMAASLAHQIRTPLSAAILYASNIGNRNVSPIAKATFLKKLMDRLKDLENQVSDILLFAKSGDNIVDKVMVEDLVASVECGTEGMITLKGASMDVIFNDPDMTIIANLTSLSSAISNLISNALEAKANHLVLAVSKKDNNVVVKIADNGSGIPIDIQSKIFEPFYTTKSTGTGLGLAVVNSVITAHQGTIRLISELGKGSCFIITIPLA
ncbi:MAG: sensor histidine kinase [Succinivibrionaceae bacterium]